jgi:hypothetical protein
LRCPPAHGEQIAPLDRPDIEHDIIGKIRTNSRAGSRIACQARELAPKLLHVEDRCQASHRATTAVAGKVRSGKRRLPPAACPRSACCRG